jgi:hypothetical protein
MQAKVLKKMPSRKMKYPWAEWTDGQARQVTLGKNEVSPVAFRNSLYSRARRINRGVTVSMVGQVVSFQFEVDEVLDLAAEIMDGIDAARYPTSTEAPE